MVVSRSRFGDAGPSCETEACGQRRLRDIAVDEQNIQVTVARDAECEIERVESLAFARNGAGDEHHVVGGGARPVAMRDGVEERPFDPAELLLGLVHQRLGRKATVLAELHEIEHDVPAMGRFRRRAMVSGSGAAVVRGGGACPRSGSSCGGAASRLAARSVLICAFCSAFSTMDMAYPSRLRSIARRFCCSRRLSRKAPTSAAMAPPTSAV